MKKRIIIGIILFALFILIDGFFINIYFFKVNEKEIYVDNLPDSFKGFKILQFSDLLISNNRDFKKLKKVVKQINELKPDIIVFTGDLINKNYNLSSEGKQNLINILNSLDCELYKYAVIGDNDNKNITLYEDIMTNSNFIVLNNESTYLFYKDPTPIKITGLTNLDNIQKSFEITDNLNTSTNIVLTHYPDYVLNLDQNVNQIILAGHSLNGQIHLPFIGGIIKKDNAKKYISDYYKIVNTNLYISGGLGTDNIPFRLFNRPEINLYRLKNNS